MQKHVNLVDLVKSFPTNIFLQKLASIQQRTSLRLVKFDHLDEKSEQGSISNLSTKVATVTALSLLTLAIVPLLASEASLFSRAPPRISLDSGVAASRRREPCAEFNLRLS